MTDANMLLELQQAGLDRAFEALGITDDRERSWSSLVLAINELKAHADSFDPNPSAYAWVEFGDEFNGYQSRIRLGREQPSNAEARHGWTPLHAKKKS